MVLRSRCAFVVTILLVFLCVLSSKLYEGRTGTTAVRKPSLLLLHLCLANTIRVFVNIGGNYMHFFSPNDYGVEPSWDCWHAGGGSLWVGSWLAPSVGKRGKYVVLSFWILNMFRSATVLPFGLWMLRIFSELQMEQCTASMEAHILDAKRLGCTVQVRRHQVTENDGLQEYDVWTIYIWSCWLLQLHMCSACWKLEFDIREVLIYGFRKALCARLFNSILLCIYK